MGRMQYKNKNVKAGVKQVQTNLHSVLQLYSARYNFSS